MTGASAALATFFAGERASSAALSTNHRKAQDMQAAAKVECCRTIRKSFYQSVIRTADPMLGTRGNVAEYVQSMRYARGGGL